LRLKKLILLFILLGFFWPRDCFSLDRSFKNKLAHLKWVAYAPTNFNPQKRRYPDEISIRADLTVLKNAGFNGIVTYGAQNSLAQIPRIAREVGFSGVIMGIWSLGNKYENDDAIRQKDYVDGYCAGNEGYKVRYDIDILRKAIKFIKAETGKPVTTSEQINDYFFDRDLIEAGDWLFPIAHPFVMGIDKPKFAVSWIQDRFRSLKKSLGKDIPILLKESGHPTGGAPGANEDAQELFFSLLERTDVPFVYFEAFDQSWKGQLHCEPYWGLFDVNRNPKKFIKNGIK
jgi:exo-beta-1,3-glucanase (GH17 family)